MNLEEFKRQLGADPDSRDPEFLEAKRGDLELARMARDAEAFEDKLASALRLPTDPELKHRILDQIEGGRPAWRSWPAGLAVAATLAIAVSLAVFLPQGEAPAGDALVEAFYEHLTHDENALAPDAPIELTRAAAVFDEIGAELAAVDGDVTYYYPCPIGGQRGIHLVMTDGDARKTTLLFAPGGVVGGAATVEAPDGSLARTFNVAGGSVYLVAHDEQPLDNMIEGLFGNTLLAAL